MTHILSSSPVFEEASQPKGYKLQNRFQDKHSGEHVVAVLEGSLQRLGIERKGNINVIKFPDWSVRIKRRKVWKHTY